MLRDAEIQMQEGLVLPPDVVGLSSHGSSCWPPSCLTLGLNRGMWPIKPTPPRLQCLKTKERRKAQQEGF